MKMKSIQSDGNSPEALPANVAGGMVFAMLAASLLLGACQTNISHTKTDSPDGNVAVVVKSDGDEAEEAGDGKSIAEKKPARVEQTGVELWADNCQRCHNFRDPSIYTDAQWDVAMFHMRTRANLTGSDYRKIREFILSAN